MMINWVKVLVTAVLLMAVACEAGPIAWGACQTACNGGAVVCYTQAGLVFGAAVASGPPGWLFAGAGPAAAAACSVAQGACMTLCTPLMVAPTP